MNETILKLKDDAQVAIQDHLSAVGQLLGQMQNIQRQLARERRSLEMAWRAAYLEYLLESGKSIEDVPAFIDDDGRINLRIENDGTVTKASEASAE